MIRRADSSGLVVRRMGVFQKKMIRRCGAAFPLAGLLLSDRKHARGSPGRCPVQLLRYDA
jgi:hypothetical protein